MTNQESNYSLPSDAAISIRTRLENFLKEYGLDEAGLSLFKHIVGRTPSHDVDFSFGHLKLIMSRAIKSDLNDSDCFKVINYFTGGHSRLLDVVLTFIDPESGEPYILTKEEARLMLFDGEFYHPLVPDELVENCKEHILVSYKPSDITTQVHHSMNFSNGRTG